MHNFYPIQHNYLQYYDTFIKFFHFMLFYTHILLIFILISSINSNNTDTFFIFIYILAKIMIQYYLSMPYDIHFVIISVTIILSAHFYLLFIYLSLESLISNSLMRLTFHCKLLPILNDYK